ncbi:MAG: hypothetical protein ACU0CI_06360 [Shimia sp.]
MSANIDRLRRAGKAAGFPGVLVRVTRKVLDAVPEPALTRGEAPAGWALWPSTLQVGAVRSGTEEEPAGPPLEAEWTLDDATTIRIVTMPDGPRAIEVREHRPGTEVAEAIDALRETVILECNVPRNMYALFHVFWIIDPLTDAPARSFDRFAGYVPRGATP